MKYSKHNIFSKIASSDKFFIVNLLSGNADILSQTEGKMLEKFIDGGEISTELAHEMEEKGYFVDEKEEDLKYRRKYLDFIDSRDNDEIQIFFVTNYTCNFACNYCYQGEYNNATDKLTTEIINAFYNYVNREFAGRKKYITIFGGEPLLSSEEQKINISYFLEKANANNLDVCVVTNGYNLADYTEILGKANIREIQVTLDGVGLVHDKRRPLKSGHPTFNNIVNGIDKCLQKGMPVNLRVVVDKDNINGLPELAEYAINKGWTGNRLFKTQIGRNYELHHCNVNSDRLFSRISLYEALYELIKLHPYIKEFHKPSYSVSKFLFENGNLPKPLFDACPACKSEWAFDYTGQIYSCTATVGKTGEALGTFFPETTIIHEAIEKWENRDVTSIKECSSCNLQLACGGGCGSIAKNKTGSIMSADCRPVKELLATGFNAYFENSISRTTDYTEK